jgi:hypothetical protein
MGHHPERENKRTFAGGAPALVPIDGGGRILGEVWRERQATNVVRERVSYGLGAPRVLQGLDALNGDVEAPGEGYVSV